ncbi:MAG TPA: PAS domain-containing sensor histidine kinase [Woeseiaceae bacterium]|nr:PAS domain-containing sensor histidine kinase [Woeseiaceae bacterium]
MQPQIDQAAAIPGETGVPAAAGATDDFFRKLLDAAPDAMIIVDTDGRIVIVNAAAEKMFGYARQQLLGACIDMLLPERFRARHEAQRKSYGTAPDVRRMGIGREFAALHCDGSEFPVEISLSPIDTSSGALVVSAIRDITERNRIDRELKAAREAAERANKANTAFLSAASHDLRQPVQALRLLTGALQRTVADPLALEMIESQQDSLDVMTNLLNSLLDISRLDAGGLEPGIEDFPLNTLVGRLASDFSRQAQQKALRFRVDACEQTVRSDPNLLGEIIRNFVSNAVRYTPAGSVHLGYTVRGDELSIEVRDSGIGIQPDQLDKIFVEFYQVPHDRRKKEGVGLGLSIARRLADLLGHAVDVESTPGKGSCFSVRVPIVPGNGNSGTRKSQAARNAPKPADSA